MLKSVSASVSGSRSSSLSFEDDADWRVDKDQRKHIGGISWERGGSGEGGVNNEDGENNSTNEPILASLLVQETPSSCLGKPTPVTAMYQLPRKDTEECQQLAMVCCQLLNVYLVE